MNNNYKSNSHSSFRLATSLVGLMLICGVQVLPYSQSLQAQPELVTDPLINTDWSFGDSDRDPYRGNSGGGSRGTCQTASSSSHAEPESRPPIRLHPNQQGHLSLVHFPSLLPIQEPLRMIGTQYSTTTEAHPTVYFYLPLENVEGYQVNLYEYNESEHRWENYSFHIFELDLVETTSPTAEGIIAVPFDDLAPLAEGKRYKWDLELLCAGNGESEHSTYIPHLPDQNLPPNMLDLLNFRADRFPTIQRLSPPENLALETTTISLATEEIPQSLNLAIAYAQAGFFLDAVDILVQLKQAHPDHSGIQETWEKLLTDSTVNLGHLVEQPILGTGD